MHIIENIRNITGLEPYDRFFWKSSAVGPSEPLPETIQVFRSSLLDAQPGSITPLPYGVNFLRWTPEELRYIERLVWI